MGRALFQKLRNFCVKKQKKWWQIFFKFNIQMAKVAEIKKLVRNSRANPKIQISS